MNRCCAILLIFSFAGRGLADELQTEVVLSGLNWPSGVAVMATEDGNSVQVVVAESGSRTISVVDSSSGESRKVVQWQAAQQQITQPRDGQPTPICVVSLSPQLFAATDSVGRAVRVYSIRGDGKPLTEQEAKQSLPISVGANSVLGHPGLDERYCYLPIRGDEPGVQRSRHNLGVLSEFQATPAINVTSPAMATGSKSGHLVILETGGWSTSADSRLKFFDPTAESDALRLDLDLPLIDAVAFAYSPTTKQLYVLDLNLDDPANGGLYRVDSAGSGAVRAEKRLTLARPSAMAFAPSGELWITTLGEGPELEGKLIKVIASL
jgi:hypothetical protein